MKIDDFISSLTKIKYATITVEIDIFISLMSGINIEIEGVDLPLFWQNFKGGHIHALFFIQFH